MPPTDPTTLEAAVELASGGLTAVATFTCARAAARGTGRQAHGWAALALAMALWTLSNVAVDVPVILGGTPSLTVTQVFQGAAIVAAVVGLSILPVARWEPGQHLRVGLDAAATSVCLLVLVGLFVAPRVLAQDSSVADHVFALLYPVVSLTLATLAYVLGRGHGGYLRWDLTLLFVGFSCWALAGVGAALLATGRAVAPPVVSLTFGVGAAFVAQAAHRALRHEETRPAVRPRSVRILDSLPEVVIGTTTLSAILVGLQTDYVWVLVVCSSTVVLVRQLVIRADARRSRDSLEHEVEERTEQLRKLNARHSRILAAVGEGIVGFDADGLITFANVAAGRLLVRDPEAMVGRQACEVLCATAHEQCPLGLVRTLGHVITEEQTTYRRGDGSLLPVEVTAAPKESPGHDGRAGVVVAFRDMTERKAMEQMKQQFVSSVSHELRTPLTSIRGMLEMLADGDAGELPASAHHMVATAQRGSERLSRLVNDIIDVEKLAIGDFSVVPRPTDVARLVGDAVASLEGLAAGSGVQVRTGTLEGIALCDPDRVVQALVNLVGNAVKFSPDGGVVTVAAVAEETEVVVSVSDAGRGIPADQLEHVFERFHQVAATDATEKGGTGLGLTITRSIVERHGGRIWVESVPGEGTTFSFTLPLAPADVVPAPSIDVPAVAS